MFIKGSFFSKGVYAFVSGLLVALSTSQVNAEELTKAPIKTDLQDKFYRQALFSYFQEDKNSALVMMKRGHEKLGKLDSRSSLFESGLQLSQGMLLQAYNTLVKFEAKLAKETQQDTSISSEQLAKTNELLVVALLTLTERYLDQGELTKAQQSLKQINHVPSQYYAQYHLLNQLSYWSYEDESQPLVLAKSSEDITKTVDDELFERYQVIKANSPYIQLNNALRFLEQDKIEAASPLLVQIKQTPWHQPRQSFWQTLFSNSLDKIDDKEAARHESQAIQDYAQLLLAQSYVKQQRFDLAYTELKAFPSNGPYAESALFLFAFAAQNVQQYEVANKLLTLHFREYPFSPLAWQSAELMAEQVSQQQSLAQGVSAYQKVESYFNQRLQSLASFKDNFNQVDNLLAFSLASPIELPEAEQQKVEQYIPQSPWLQHALLDSQLSNLYQGIIDIDKLVFQCQLLIEKTVWIAEIIRLNQARKQRIVEQLQQQNYQDKIRALQNTRNKLASQLSVKADYTLSSAFADKTQSKWLERINRSESVIDAIAEQKDTDEYQQRLTRLKGVLAWQMSEQHAERAWQHKQQLKHVDQSLVRLIDKEKKVRELSLSEANLSEKMLQKQQSKLALEKLLVKLSHLRSEMTGKAKKQVALFIEQQSLLLNEHLLSTRRGMAKVLEQMSEVDRKMAIKLGSAKLAANSYDRQYSPVAIYTSIDSRNENALSKKGAQ